MAAALQPALANSSAAITSNPVCVMSASGSVAYGMTPAQVTALLGPPTRVSTDGPTTVLHFGSDRVVVREQDRARNFDGVNDYVDLAPGPVGTYPTQLPKWCGCFQ